MGQSKAWLPFGEEVLLQRMVRLVSRSVGPIVVVAAPEQDLPPLPDFVTLARDAVADRGPLQGLATGLAALPSGVEFAFATSTDAPFLAEGWIPRLRERIGSGDLAIPLAQGYHHPLASLYRRSTCLSVIENLLHQGRMRPMFLIEAVDTVVLTEGDFLDVDPELGSLRNLNTPEDYQRALAVS